MPTPRLLPCVLITGAAKRLGREIALNLASAGWQVAVHCRHSRAEAEQTAADCAAASLAAGHSGARHTVLCADLGHEAAVRTLVPQAVAIWGRLDAVVNSASTFEFDDAASFGYAALERHLSANTGAAIVLAQALHDHVTRRCPGEANVGTVVNLLDQKLWNLNPDFLSYTLSKAALETANQVLARALAPALRVVGVAPGLTLTSPTMTAETFEAMHRLSPLGRSSRPQDVANAVRFCLGNAAVTGTTLLVDGGQHLMKFDRDFSVMPGDGGIHPATPQLTPQVAPAVGPPSASRAAASFAPPPSQGGQVLRLRGLRFDANLGILEHEKTAPQPIQVDAELHLGVQDLLPRDDDIHHVLDYRKVRKIIIDECTSEHVNLLESLIGKLALRLLQLRGVQGVRVRIAKLEIFDDCEVAIQVEAGQW